MSDKANDKTSDNQKPRKPISETDKKMKAWLYESIIGLNADGELSERIIEVAAGKGYLLQKRGIMNRLSMRTRIMVLSDMYVLYNSTEEDIKEIAKVTSTLSVGDIRNAQNEIKKVVLAREKENMTEVIVVKSETGNIWWKIFDHSALFYARVILPKISENVRRKLKPDESYGPRAEIGWVAVNNIKDLHETFVKKCGMQLYENTSLYRIYKIGDVIPEEVLQMEIDTEDVEQEKINNLVLPIHTPAKLNMAITKLLILTVGAVRKQKPDVREIIGPNLTQPLFDAKKLLVCLSIGAKPSDEAFSEIFILLTEYRAALSAVYDLRFIDQHRMKNILRVLGEADAALSRAMKSAAFSKVEWELHEGRKQRRMRLSFEKESPDEGKQ